MNDPLPNGWRRASFGDVIEDVSRGNAKVPKSQLAMEGSFPVVDQGQMLIAGYTNDASKLCKAELPVIVFGDHTRRFKFIDFPFCMGADGTKVLRPRDGDEPRYLYHFFGSLDLPDAGYSRHFKFLKNCQIILPPPAEQRRIVEVLDRAEALRATRRAALEASKTLTQAIFIEIFGHPARAENRWPITSVGEAGRVQLGRQRAPKYQTGTCSRPYVRVANVYEDRIELSDVLSMDFHDRDFKSYRLEYGDILLNEGQSTELVGRPAMWRNELDDCCFQNTLVRFQPDRARVTPEFALAVFLIYFRSGEFAKVSSKTSNVAHLGLRRFAAMPFPVPPLSLQHEFANRIASVERQKDLYSASMMELDTLFASLQQRAFRGEL